MAEHKPPFDLTVVNPALVTGPMLHPVSRPRDVSLTVYVGLYILLHGAIGHIEKIRWEYYHFVRSFSPH